ncbi:MAG: hypothetical protein ACJ8AW_01515 [Rhodopila sp.]
MGEAHRRKLAGTYPQRTESLSRADAIAWGMNFLTQTEDETVSGMTIFPADGSPPVYLPATAAKRPPGRRH